MKKKGIALFIGLAIVGFVSLASSLAAMRCTGYPTRDMYQGDDGGYQCVGPGGGCAKCYDEIIVTA